MTVRTFARRAKRRIPWPMKMALKILLSRLPVSYRVWARLHVTRHGDMDVPEYAFGVFRRHFDRVEFGRKNEGGFVALELGPGDSLFSALIAKSFGASEVYLVDVAPFACGDSQPYLNLVSFLRKAGHCTAPFEKCRTVDELLAACSAHYLTDGLKSLREIPSGSVDFVWSHGVLQSVRRHELGATLRELRRIQRRDGAGSHLVELKDCLAGALNNLRFGERFWESDLIAKSGFYTNRVRCTPMLELFREAGFEPEVVQTERWPRLPTPRSKLAPAFRDLPDDELIISTFDVVLR